MEPSHPSCGFCTFISGGRVDHSQSITASIGAAWFMCPLRMGGLPPTDRAHIREELMRHRFSMQRSIPVSTKQALAETISDGHPRTTHVYGRARRG